MSFVYTKVLLFDCPLLKGLSPFGVFVIRGYIVTVTCRDGGSKVIRLYKLKLFFLFYLYSAGFVIVIVLIIMAVEVTCN